MDLELKGTTLGDLAQALGAEILPAYPGDGKLAAGDAEPRSAAVQRQIQQVQIDHVSRIESAARTSLVFVEDAATLARALGSSAGAILLPPALAPALPASSAIPALLSVSQPRLSFARAARLLMPTVASSGIHPEAFVAHGAQLADSVAVGAFAVVEKGAMIGQGTHIGPGAVIGAGCVVGADCHIYPRAVLYPGIRLGDRVVVHAGAVLGADGFGYVRDKDTGAYTQFPQQGTLVIEDDVEIGANTTIDRGALEETRIGRGTKLDNLVHIGHNVQVGEDVVIAAQTGISGSCSIGRGAVIAGQVGLGDHAGVGEGVILGGQAGVLPHKHLKGPGVLFWGTPAKPLQQYLRELATLARLGRRRARPAPDAAEEGK